MYFCWLVCALSGVSLSSRKETSLFWVAIANWRHLLRSMRPLWHIRDIDKLTLRWRHALLSRDNAVYWWRATKCISVVTRVHNCKQVSKQASDRLREFHNQLIYWHTALSSLNDYHFFVAQKKINVRQLPFVPIATPSVPLVASPFPSLLPLLNSPCSTLAT